MGDNPLNTPDSFERSEGRRCLNEAELNSKSVEEESYPTWFPDSLDEEICWNGSFLLTHQKSTNKLLVQLFMRNSNEIIERGLSWKYLKYKKQALLILILLLFVSYSAESKKIF